MKILGIGYRDWSIEIYKNLKLDNKKIIIIKKKKISFNKIKKINPDLILFYGWSDKVSDKIVQNYRCIGLHPSKLPKFAGGSPIQNQIIRNVKKSAVTLFLMNEKIDHGNILQQKKLDLSGDLSEIFNRIIKIGTQLSLNILKNKYIEKKTKIRKLYKRRTPAQSEITLEEIKFKRAQYLYNKIRMLQNPYPNAFIRTYDGKKLYIQKATISKKSDK